jgi:hypothetical protein
VVLVGGGVVGGAVVGGLVGAPVGMVVGRVGGAVGTVGGVSVTTGVVGALVSTVCGVGVPAVSLGYDVVPTPTGGRVSPGLVAVGNGVGTAVGVVPGVGVAVRGTAGTFCVGWPGCRPATGLAGCGPRPSIERTTSTRQPSSRTPAPAAAWRRRLGFCQGGRREARADIGFTRPAGYPLKSRFKQPLEQIPRLSAMIGEFGASYATVGMQSVN